jgi:hypothetical protein
MNACTSYFGSASACQWCNTSIMVGNYTGGVIRQWVYASGPGWNPGDTRWTNYSATDCSSGMVSGGASSHWQ